MKVDYDKIIKDFFLNVRIFLECKLRKSAANKDAIEHAISCMRMFESNPAKFTQKDQIKINYLFIASDGFGDRLFDIVYKMIATVRAYYSASPAELIAEENRILELNKKAKILMVSRYPVQMIKHMRLNNKIH